MMTAFRADRIPAVAQGDAPASRRTAEPEHTPRPWPRFDILTAAACLLVALLMRWHAADHGLSFDETWMLAGAAGHGSDCLKWTPDELRLAPTSPTALEHAASPLTVWTRGVIMHPPLHMATLWFWRALFGESDWVAAMYSAVWSIAAIGFLFAAIRLQAGVAPAALVALTMALSPMQVQLGTEVRGYGMMIGLAACAAWQMVRMESLGATRLGVWLLGLTLCPLQLTHYFAAGACTAVCLWAMLRLTGSLRWHFIAAVACAAAITLVSWLPFAIDHLRRAGTGDVAFLQATGPFWSGAGKAGLSLPLKLLFMVSPALRGPFGLLLMASVMLVAAGLYRSSKVTTWALMLWTPIAMLMLLDASRGTHHTTFTRYAAVASVGAAAAPILSAFLVSRPLGWVVGTLFVALTAVGFAGPRNVGSVSFHHMSKALTPIISSESDRLPIVSLMPPAGPYQFYGAGILLEWSHAPGFFPRPAMLMKKAPPAAVRALAAASPDQRLWLVTFGRETAGTEMPDWLHALLPTATLVGPPVVVPAGQSGVQPEPAVALWLLKLNEPPAASREE